MTPPWRPDRFARRRPHLAARGRAVNACRRVFASRGFTEVETPALQVSPGLEPHLMAFETRIQDLNPAGQRPLYLHTSPEFAMKKLLAAGLPRIWQMARVFRNGERSATHHPEFTMVEWYRAGDGYQTLIGDCQALVRAVATACGGGPLTWQGRRCDPFGDWLVLSVSDAFLEYAGFDPLRTIAEDGTPDRDILAMVAEPLGIQTDRFPDWDGLFFEIMLGHVEPHLGEGRPVVLIDYPVHMAALSRPNPAAPELAERFEIYICGMELANAFGELADAEEQARRFRADMAEKRRLYGIEYPIDGDFLDALRHGLPESAGIALGFDRLVMLATGAARIDDVLWLPVADAP